MHVGMACAITDLGWHRRVEARRQDQRAQSVEKLLLHGVTMLRCFCKSPCQFSTVILSLSVTPKRHTPDTTCELSAGPS